jgi:glycosyltransferase involved in cell wall biosynthesis
MRILYACHQFFPDYGTGTERYTLQLAQQMQRMGHSVSVLTYATKALGTQPSARAAILRWTYEYEGVPVIGLRHVDFDSRGGLPSISFELSDPVIFQEIKQFLAEQSFDLLHCIHPMRTGEAMRAAKESELKVVLHLMDYWMICPRVTLQRLDGSLCDGPDHGRNCAKFCYQDNEIRERLFKRYAASLEILGMVDTVLSPSRFLIEVFKQGGVDTRGFVHCPNGFDYAKVKFSNRELGRRDTINFAFIGTILPHNGVEILVDAFKRVPSDNIRLKIYGGCFEEREYYLCLLAKAEEDKRIEFWGDYAFNSIASVLEEIDVVVVPSLWYENAPLVISTAQAFGIPVIATRLGGMKEMVVDGVNGFTFRVGDIEDLVDKIRTTAANPRVLSALSRNKMPPARIESEAFLLERLYSGLIGRASY